MNDTLKRASKLRTEGLVAKFTEDVELAERKLGEAAKLFESVDMKREAMNCYASFGDYDQAIGLANELKDRASAITYWEMQNDASGLFQVESRSYFVDAVTLGFGHRHYFLDTPRLELDYDWTDEDFEDYDPDEDDPDFLDDDPDFAEFLREVARVPDIDIEVPIPDFSKLNK